MISTLIQGEAGPQCGPDSGLAPGWHRIALMLARFGFQNDADNAHRAALAAEGRTP
jgi:hypothetical protein